MQVRKFEAKTMKEALDLVKQHLGPEAIILSARDNSKGFGLMGEKSVEVTAAVSEETLRKKKLAEAKLRESVKSRFSQSPAKVQKQFIDRSYAKSAAPVPVGAGAMAASDGAVTRTVKAIPRPPSTQRYIDIDEEDRDMMPAVNPRVSAAAQAARAAAYGVAPATPRAPAPRPNQNSMAAVAAAVSNLPPPRVNPAERIESQITELKTMLEKFNKVPQNMVNAHPGADEGIAYELSGAYQRLQEAGIQTSIIVGWLKDAKADLDREHLKKPHLIDAWLVQKILRETAVSKDPIGSRYHIFLGTTAQGKTSSLVKMASQLVLKEKRRIALISLDTIKVGAADQLKIYAQILNVPFAVVRERGDWALLEQRVKDVHHVLVDAPGLSLKTMEEVEWIKQLIPQTQHRRLHFVQSALARDEECFEIASRYRMLNFDDVIFTRLDETVRHGLIINFQKQFQTQLHSFGTGTQIPEDFEFASKERVADLIFKISKLKKREGSI